MFLFRFYGRSSLLFGKIWYGSPPDYSGYLWINSIFYWNWYLPFGNSSIMGCIRLHINSHWCFESKINFKAVIRYNSSYFSLTRFWYLEMTSNPFFEKELYYCVSIRTQKTIFFLS